VSLPASMTTQPAFADRILEISGLPLHIRCGGERRPAMPLVILEAGGGNSADTWRDVLAPIAQFARVCAYDRPSRGSSGTSRESLGPDAYVKLLFDLLQAASEPGRYVLVGHSIGGVIAALFANTNPQTVAGMVLVDSAHQDQLRRFAALNTSMAPAPVARTIPPGGQQPEPLPVSALIETLSKKPWRGTIPLVVLTRGRIPSPNGDPNAEARNDIWLELQRDWATRSSNARQIVASNSGHFIQNDQPTLVIDAVRWVLDEVARSKRP
jgi:pimeloyl-ACP methyl ester carboxylesterase